MKPAVGPFTVSDYLKYPEGARVQLIEGGLVMEPASPNLFHQDVSRNVTLLLANHVRARSLGKVYAGPVDVFLSDHDVLVPDVLFVSNENAGVLAPDGLHGAPDLVVEVLSPSTARIDLKTKRKLYAHHGVRELWLIDPWQYEIQQFDFTRNTARPVQQIGESKSFSSPLFPGLLISAAEIFRT